MPVRTLPYIHDRDYNVVIDAGSHLTTLCHTASHLAGWWTDKNGNDIRHNTEVLDALVPTKLMLIVSEVAEGMEGHRKGKDDDHLPHRSMIEVELADAAIRIFDLAGALGFDLGAAIAEKLQYNANRPDHKAAARSSEGGKRY